MAADSTQPRPAPFLQVVRGDLSPEEIAALVAVLTARARAAQAERDAAAPMPRSAWRDRSRMFRPWARPGPDAWRGSFRPG